MVVDGARRLRLRGAGRRARNTAKNKGYLLMQIRFLRRHSERANKLTKVTFEAGHVLTVPAIDDGIEALIEAGIVEVVETVAAKPEGEPEGGAGTGTLDDLKVDELREMAVAAGIENASKMRKAELIEAISAHADAAEKPAA